MMIPEARRCDSFYPTIRREYTGSLASKKDRLARARFAGSILMALITFTAALPARANVYATNIKINDGLTNVSVTAGTLVQISYILNEPASAGVQVNILNGSKLIRTISIPGGSPGTVRGKNTVAWDGNGADGLPVQAGTYSVTVNAASQGYGNWTQITDDNADGNAVWQGRGIAVDQNTNSAHYGRVFVANAQENDLGLTNWLGFHLGILKCNADGSYADEGGLSTGGYAWAGDTLSPWHLEVSGQDRVYVDDFTTNGQVISWDAAISTNSLLAILRPDNWPDPGVNLSGPALSISGTNRFLWMADTRFSSGLTVGLGILRYTLLPNGTCAMNDTGVTAVAVGGSLTANPFDVALDSTGNLYTIQPNSDPGDPSNRVFRFPPFTATSPGAIPLTNADWAIGSMDDTMAGARGIAVDPTGTYVAVAFAGLSTSQNGCTQVFYASNGAPVINLDLGVTISGVSDHEDQDCAWDAVGNLYYIDNFFSVWRAFSPPGTNQATTTALPLIQVTSGAPAVAPEITEISIIAGLVVIEFTAGNNDAADAFNILASSGVAGPYSIVHGASVTNVAPGQFKATLPAGTSTQYFRISRPGTPPPTGLQFTKIATSANTVLLTFSGSTSDSPSAFTVLGAASVNENYSALPNATVSLLSPGLFQAVVPLSGPAQFYRIKR
jgi:hypothetical protein